MKHTKKLNKKRWIILAVCLVIALAAGGYAIGMTVNKNRNETVYESMRMQVQNPVTDISVPLETPVPTATPEADTEPVVELDSYLTVDFDTLRETNSDIFAWIDIPDTDISYPMLQNEMDNYYLMRNLDGSYGYPSCIYINSCNDRDMSDFNTLVYGHNMKDGSMFGHLKYYFDEVFFSQHRRIVIYTPEKILVYRVMAVADYDDRYIPTAFNENTEAGRTGFIDSLEDAASIFMDDLPMDGDSRLITLSTCTSSSSRRVLVTAVYEGVGQPRAE